MQKTLEDMQNRATMQESNFDQLQEKRNDNLDKWKKMFQEQNTQIGEYIEKYQPVA